MTNKLNELVRLCGINDIEFTIHKSETNSVEYINEEKKFVVNFSDVEDKEFEKLLDSKISELKETFK
jgi:hypothetical protein